MIKRSKRFWTHGSNTLIVTLFFIAILVFVALIAQRHPWRLDLTKAGNFTLSPQSQKILEAVHKPIVIKAFYATAASDRSSAKDLLGTYHYYNSKITYQFIDPDRRPEVARRYHIHTYGTLVLEGYGKQQTIETANEQNITNGIFKLISKGEKKIYFLIGHGEHPLDGVGKEGYSTVQSALKRDDYEVAKLNLLQRDQVPKDAAVVVIAGPRKPLFPQEIAALQAYVARGGKVIALVDPFSDGGLTGFLKSYGLRLKNDIVIDKLSRIFGGSYLMPVVTQYGADKITRHFRLATFYPEARSVTVAKHPPKGVHDVILASTSPSSWAETNLAMLKKGVASFNPKKDIRGPVPLAAIARIEHAAPQPAGTDHVAAKNGKQDHALSSAPPVKGYVLAVGNSTFIDNTDFNLSGNGDLFMNMVNYLANEQSLITIHRCHETGHPVLLTASEARLILLTVLIFIPLLVVGSGLIVYRVRRSQR